MTTTAPSPESASDEPALVEAAQDDTATLEGSVEEKPGFLKRVAMSVGPRRQYLINRKRQLRTALLLLVVVLLLLIPLNYAFHTVRLQETATITSSNPNLSDVMTSRDRNELFVGVIASVVILVGVFALTIIETHRTAGAAYAVARRMDDVRDGNLTAQLELRGGDNLRELEAPFNAMAEALRDRAEEDARTLADLADRASDIVVPSEAQELAAQLRRLAKKKRKAAGTA